MSDQGDFEAQYFIQTRREIDTEKHSRDQILNFAVVVLGAIAFAIFRSGDVKLLLTAPFAIIPECCGLLVITALFWVRRKKLQQIADRWFVLRRLAVRMLGEERSQLLLEGHVCRHLLGRRYLEKDFFLNYALCSPIYALLVVHLQGFWSGAFWWAFMAGIVIATHAVLSGLLLGHRLDIPEASESAKA